MEYRDFQEHHVAEVMRLCASAGWPSLSTDQVRTLRALTAPGVAAVVSIADGKVVGFAQAMGDGEITAYLSHVLVDGKYRGQGIGRRLVQEVFRRCGGERMDLLSVEEAEGFYRTFPHRQMAGYRIYPEVSP
ncbi:MAG: GNAT family N-acetyltransferase [Chloroflexi bacterium]|nr:GNAT family N-acetyltransferase [Chloroflexota bacterium]